MCLETYYDTASCWWSTEGVTVEGDVMGILLLLKRTNDPICSIFGCDDNLNTYVSRFISCRKL